MTRIEQPSLSLKVTGELHLNAGEAWRCRPPRKDVRMLWGYLALRRGRSLDRKHVAFELWPDVSDRVALQRLRRMVYELQQDLLGAPPGTPVPLVSGARDITLLAGPELVIDVERFTHACADLEMLSGADLSIIRTLDAWIEQGSGPLLPEFHDEPWIVEAQTMHADRLRQAMSTLRDRYFELDELEAAIRCGRRVVECDPVSERAWGELMRLLHTSGRVAEAIKAYELATEAIQDAVQIEPAAWLTQLRDAILRSATSRELDRILVRHDPKPPPLKASIPRPLSTFVGRQSELARVDEAFRVGRLVSIVGPGGFGKTRLAIEAVNILSADFPDGIWFLELDQIKSNHGVPIFLAQALGLAIHDQASVEEQVAGHLGRKRALLVLDNCEHVIKGARQTVEELHTRCANLSILATSRQILDTANEMVLFLASMQSPERGTNLTEAELRGNESVELFIDRMQAGGIDSLLSRTDLLRIARICRVVDGIPLAIELAAARATFLPLDFIERGLYDHPFEILAGGTEIDRPERHETMWKTIEWSFQLLDQEGRDLVLSLSVFTSDFSQDNVRCVCLPRLGMAVSNPDDTTEILSQNLRCLSDCSIILETKPAQMNEIEPDSGKAIDGHDLLSDMIIVADLPRPAHRRWRLTSHLREFCLHQLEAKGAFQPMQAACSQYYVEVAIEAEKGFQGPDQIEWLSRLNEESSNIYGIMNWLSEMDRWHQALSLGIGLSRYWYQTDQFAITTAWLQEVVLAYQSEAEHYEFDLAKAKHGLALLFYGTGQYVAAHQLLEEARRIYELHASEHLIIECKFHLGVMRQAMGQLKLARELYDECALGLANLEDDGRLVDVTSLSARIAHRTIGVDEAIRLYQVALARLSSKRDRLFSELSVRDGYTFALAIAENYPKAIQEANWVISQSHGHGLVAWKIGGLINRSIVYRRTGHLDSAVKDLQDALRLADLLLTSGYMINVRYQLGLTYQEYGDHERAELFLSFATNRSRSMQLTQEFLYFDASLAESSPNYRFECPVHEYVAGLHKLGSDPTSVSSLGWSNCCVFDSKFTSNAQQADCETCEVALDTIEDLELRARLQRALARQALFVKKPVWSIKNAVGACKYFASLGLTYDADESMKLLLRANLAFVAGLSGQHVSPPPGNRHLALCKIYDRFKLNRSRAMKLIDDGSSEDELDTIGASSKVDLGQMVDDLSSWLELFIEHDLPALIGDSENTGLGQ